MPFDGVFRLLFQFGGKAIYVEAEGFEKLAPYPGALKISRKNNGFIVETESQTDAMKHVLQEASSHGVEILALEMVRPSLESVFLSLTGTSLRD